MKATVCSKEDQHFIRVVKRNVSSRTSVSSFISSSKISNACSICKHTVYTRVQATACLFCNVKQFWAYPAAWFDKDQLQTCTYVRNMTDLWISESLCPPWEISRDNGSNSTRTFAHSLEFEVFEIISLIGLVFSTMEHYTCELFCCLACDCNYRDEKLYDVNFTSRLFCTRQNIIFKALGHFESFLKLYMYIQIETFMCTIPSHKIKQLSN